MRVFDVHEDIKHDFTEYVRSFFNISDERISAFVHERIDAGEVSPEPLIQFNPSYLQTETLDRLIKEGKVHKNLPRIFGNYKLYQHQVEAIERGVNDQGFIVTSGTGSGKSLTFLGVIFNKILKSPRKKGIKAVLIYPMNALINSQYNEIEEYNRNYGEGFPSYAKYTGQEGPEERERIKREEPDIILTNYMMLELMMIRRREKWFRDSIGPNLQYLVFDELHTFRGRQGADVAMLVRRIRASTQHDLICIGTSATMSTEGSREERKEVVAGVGSKIFGIPFSADQVIGEKLRLTTTRDIPTKEVIAASIRQPIHITDPPDQFLKHPLVIWLENNVGLHIHKDGYLERGKPRKLTEMTALLSDWTGMEAEECSAAIQKVLEWSERLNESGSKESPRKTYLPFRLHQFFSAPANIKTTLGSRNDRELTFAQEYYMESNGVVKKLFQVLFSRYSGQDFLCVELDYTNGKIEPRDPDDIPIVDQEERNEEQAYRAGYIMPHYDNAPDTQDEFIELLPPSALRKNGTVKPPHCFRIPRQIFYNEAGEFSFSEDSTLPLRGWYAPARLYIDPSCGVMYDGPGSERTKLTSLGNIGRSTATTISAFSALKSLNDQDTPKELQKIMSFTDNRQDASLQSGHFNDFLVLGRMRSALYHALHKAGDGGLTIDTIGTAIAKELNLDESEYAKNPSQDPRFPDEANIRALKEFLTYRSLKDLGWGWSYALPNLENCGLVKIHYQDLSRLCSYDDLFEPIRLLRAKTAAQREHVLIQILHFFRSTSALDHRFLLEDRDDLENRLNDKLDSDKLWSLDKSEHIQKPPVLCTTRHDVRNLQVISIGPRSYLGKYLTRLHRAARLPIPKEDDRRAMVEAICNLLATGHFLKPERIGRDHEDTAYRIRTDKITWKIGNGEVLPDYVRVNSMEPQAIQPNAFFQSFYQQDFSVFPKPYIGREHTGQLRTNDRIDRENGFREGEISALFCSPTMELGIDIASLNLVHMRNVPPSPANYVQRSGRAGRSGQTALVLNYCSRWSPHDSHYFERPEMMVAGVVTASRMDLTNEELVFTHLNSFIFQKLNLDHIDVSVNQMLNMDDPAMPILADIETTIDHHIERYQDQWVNEYKACIADFIEELKDSHWYTDEWLALKIRRFKENLNGSLDRWRELYRYADRMVQQAHNQLQDPNLTREAKRSAKRRYSIGLRQKELLTNSSNSTFGSESEFYVFRYLASEAFLPGYNFTRLPIRTFVGRRNQREEGEFISRSRNIAISEFGPQNLIYHNGSKYKVSAMPPKEGDLQLHSLTLCLNSGYAFIDQEAQGQNNDPITGEPLSGMDVVKSLNNVLELSDVEAFPQERISSMEEERTRQGFEIEHFISVPEGVERIKEEVSLQHEEQELLRLLFFPAARIVQINHKWRRSQQEHFLIDNRNGRWRYERDRQNEQIAPHLQEVKIFTYNTTDILYVEHQAILNLSREALISLTYALQRGMEDYFQVESSEINAILVGSEASKRIVIYEASEGSLGILKQLINNAEMLRGLFKRAYELMHFDPETGEDLKPEVIKASYEDLLSYYNQPHHKDLDRHLIKECLEQLMHAQLDGVGSRDSYEEQYKRLKSQTDGYASTEIPFLDYLRKNGLRLPDRAQVNLSDVTGVYASADFVYKVDSTFYPVFCNGGVHLREDVKNRDEHLYALLRDRGYVPIVWQGSNMEDLKQLIDEFKHVFRKVR